MPEEFSATPLTRSKWSRSDLHGKTVEFHLTYTDGSISSVGRFLIRRSEGELMAVEIDWTEVRAGESIGRYQYYPLFQRHVDRIERHPKAGDDPKLDFQVLA